MYKLAWMIATSFTNMGGILESCNHAWFFTLDGTPKCGIIKICPQNTTWILNCIYISCVCVSWS